MPPKESAMQIDHVGGPPGNNQTDYEDDAGTEGDPSEDPTREARTIASERKVQVTVTETTPGSKNWVVVTYKNFEPGDSSAYAEAENACLAVIHSLPRSGGSIWGTTSDGVGGHVGLTHGYCEIKCSGVSNKAIKFLREGKGGGGYKHHKVKPGDARKMVQGLEEWAGDEITPTKDLKAIQKGYTSVLQIRPKNYRGKDGFVLSGRPEGADAIFPVSIFFESREAAERVRDKYRENPHYETSMDDFNYTASSKKEDHEQSGQAVSDLDDVEVGDENDVPAFPWNTGDTEADAFMNEHIQVIPVTMPPPKKKGALNDEHTGTTVWIDGIAYLVLRGEVGAEQATLVPMDGRGPELKKSWEEVVRLKDDPDNKFGAKTATHDIKIHTVRREGGQGARAQSIFCNDCNKNLGVVDTVEEANQIAMKHHRDTGGVVKGGSLAGKSRPVRKRADIVPYDEDEWNAQFEDEESDFPSEPEEEDWGIESFVRGGYNVGQFGGGQHLGEFDSVEEGLAAIREEMDRSGFFPNVWFVSDHGNAWIIDPQTGNEIKSGARIGRLGQPVGSARVVRDAVSGERGDEFLFEHVADLSTLKGNYDEDPGDQWGSVMSWLFGIAEVLNIKAPNLIPPEWEFSPGLSSGQDVEPEEWPDSLIYELVTAGQATPEDLVAFGNELQQKKQQLEAEGKAY
jgi:hypothetical protein